MPLDPSIALQAGQGVKPVDPMAAFQQVMMLRAMSDQSKAQQLGLQQQERAMQRQEGIGKSYVVGPNGQIDQAATLRNLTSGGFGPEAAQFGHQMTMDSLARQKAERESTEAGLKATMQKFGIVNNALGALASRGANVTYADAARTALALRSQGVDVNLDEIPQDPAQLQAYIQEKLIQTDKAFQNWWSTTQPMTGLGKSLRDRDMWMANNAVPDEASTVGAPNVQPGMGVQAGQVTTRPAASPFDAAIRREQEGDENKPFGRDYRGNIVPRQNVQAFELAARKAGASNHTVKMGQEGEEAKTVGRGMGDLYLSLQQSARDSRSKNAKIDRMNQLLQGVETGRLTPLGMELSGFAQSLGLQIDPKLGNKEAAEAIANEFALELRNPSGGAGMPGAMSDQDRKYLQSMAPGLSKTTAGRKFISESYKKIAQRNEEVARLARDYRRKNGMLDEGFEDELQKFSDSNPLFPTREQIDAELAKRKGK